jgi:hypothetical protein
LGRAAARPTYDPPVVRDRFRKLFVCNLMPRLHFINEGLEGKSYELVAEKTSVGRAIENLLCIHHDSLSRRHAEILVYGSEVIVCDLGSKNGTRVGIRRLSDQQCQARSGDLIRFGSVEARLEIELPSKMEDASTIGYSEMVRLQAEAEDRRQQEQAAKVNWAVHNGEMDRTLDLPKDAPAHAAERVSTLPPPGNSKLSRSKVLLAVAVLFVAVLLLLRFLL